MALSPRLIRRRIRSVANTRKITKAMEMVSAAKMRKAVSRALSSRAYAKLAYEVVERVAKTASPSLHPLLSGKKKREDENEVIGAISGESKTAVLLVSSNRGLCGGFNSQIGAKALKAIEQISGPSEIITLGKKGREVLQRNAVPSNADFLKSDMTNRLEDILPVARLLLKEFMEGRFNKVLLVYTHFASALSQKPTIRQLLPLSDELLARAEREELAVYENESDYLFEPNPQELLNTVLPRILELQVYQAILESEASEHSARMLTMRNATDAAKDMIDGLTLIYNQARQAGITREIAEISGGKAALEA